MKGLRNFIAYYQSLTTVLLISALVFASGCAKKEVEEIRIGAIAPLTGDAAIYGTALKKGMDLAIEQINEQGGVGGKNLVVIYEDSQANPNIAVAACQKLINIDKVSIILGDMFSSTSLAIAPIAEKSEIVLLSPTASAEAVPNIGEYIFSIFPSDSYDGKFIANFIYNELHKKNAAVLFVQADAMIVVKDEFRKTLESLGGTVTYEESYSPKTDDFRSILAKMKLKNDEFIFVVSYLEDLAKLLRQARELGIKNQFITISTAFDVKLIELTGGAAEGLLMSAPFYDLSSIQPEVVSFHKSFNFKYGGMPNVWAAYGYDVMNIAALAYSRAYENKTGLNIELLKIRNYPGVTGTTSFLENGSVEKLLRIMQINDGTISEFGS